MRSLKVTEAEIFFWKEGRQDKWGLAVGFFIPTAKSTTTTGVIRGLELAILTCRCQGTNSSISCQTLVPIVLYQPWVRSPTIDAFMTKPFNKKTQHGRTRKLNDVGSTVL